MNNDTPKTDANLFEPHVDGSMRKCSASEPDAYVKADFARKLERENTKLLSLAGRLLANLPADDDQDKLRDEAVAALPNAPYQPHGGNVVTPPSTSTTTMNETEIILRVLFELSTYDQGKTLGAAIEGAVIRADIQSAGGMPDLERDLTELREIVALRYQGVIQERLHA
jgi:hypothetical protein